MFMGEEPLNFQGVIPKRQRVAGVKATERAVSLGKAQRVLIAKDAEPRVLKDLLKICSESGIQVEYLDSMKRLGQLAGLRVGSAACAILNDGEDL